MRVILVFLCLGLLGATAVAEPLAMRVMSFNVRYGSANDGPNSWEHRKGIVAGMLKEYRPDIIGTQECLEFQADFISEQLRGYRWLGIGRDKNGRGEMTAVVYDARALVPLESGTFWLSESPEVPASRSWDAALHRIVTWVRFHHWSSDTIFYFVNTHFDHMGQKARLHSAVLLAERLRSLPEDKPIILTGDFNTGDQSKAYRAFIDKGMSDAWTASPEASGGTDTFGGWGPPVEGDTRIDWILFRGPVSAQRCETVLFNEDGRYPSDHFPVVADLSLNP